MRILDRYLLAEWLKIFVLSFLVIFGILLLEDIYDDLPDLLGYGATAGEIVHYYLVMLPSFVPTVLPVALLVSILFALSGLHRKNEIVAMRAAGLNIFRITRSLWMMGLFMAAGLFFLNAAWVPWSVQQTRLIRDHLRFANEASKEDQVGMLTSFTYDNPKTHRLWFMNAFSEYTYQGYGVTVFVRNESGQEIQRIIAQEAFYDDVDGHWVFVNGREVMYEPQSGDPVRSLAFDQKEMQSFTQTPYLMQVLSQRPGDLSLYELRDVLSDADLKKTPKLRPYAVRYQSILVSPISCFIVVCLAIPFAVSGVRVNPMVGVSKCVALLFAYYFIANISRLLGEQHVLPVALAAWLPITLVAGLSFWLYRKVI